MFNFFDELKKELVLENALLNSFNIINMSNQLLYAEGHKGVFLISEESISFKIPRGVVIVSGQNLHIKKITASTLTIQGKIEKVETM